MFIRGMTLDQSELFELVKPFGQQAVGQSWDGATKLRESLFATEQASKNDACPSTSKQFHGLLEHRAIASSGGVVVLDFCCLLCGHRDLLSQGANVLFKSPKRIVLVSGGAHQYFLRFDLRRRSCWSDELQVEVQIDVFADQRHAIGDAVVSSLD